MRTIVVRISILALLGWLIGLWCPAPSRAFPVLPPKETLAGLTPGISTIADATRLYGVYDVQLPGDYAVYSGGPYGSNAYRWTDGSIGKVPGLIVETELASPKICTIVIDQYPGLGTSRGLMALVPEGRAIQQYGKPDYAYELRFQGDTVRFHELYYIDQGLLVVTGQVDGRPNWTVTKLILTYPTYLRNAVAKRNSYALVGNAVEDITESYRAQVHGWVNVS